MERETLERHACDCRDVAAALRQQAALLEQAAEALEATGRMAEAGDLEDMARRALAFLDENAGLLKKVAGR